MGPEKRNSAASAAAEKLAPDQPKQDDGLQFFRSFDFQTASEGREPTGL
jgi:hypothetical protein